MEIRLVNRPNKLSPQYIRLCILSKGLLVSDSVQSEFKKLIKEPLRTRAGAAGGLDLILEDGSVVNAPVMEKFSRKSPYLLDHKGKEFVLKKQNKVIQQVRFPKRPSYYNKTTSDGTPMSKIGILLGDRLAISINNSCIFWETNNQCKYCSIGLNGERDLQLKSTKQITETVSAAISEGLANHVAINAGSFGGMDRGAKIYAKYSKAILKHNKVHIAAQLLPPSDLRYVDLLKKAGYSEVTYDMEIFNWRINSKLSPGKAKIGRKHYLETLKHAVKVFGKGNVSSNLIVGLESPESTAKGVEALVKIGVVPKLIIFRPLTGTPLENRAPPSIENILKTYNLVNKITTKYGAKLGPLCEACNNNRLTRIN